MRAAVLCSLLFLSACGPRVLAGSSCEEYGVGAEACQLTAMYLCDGKRWQKTTECHHKCVVRVPTEHDEASIAASETWTCEDGPHLVKQVTTLAPGVTLTVEAGAEVRFAPGARLDTMRESRVVAEGDAYSPILFTSDNRERGGWGSANQGGLNLFLREPGEEPSVLRYVLVERAVNGVGLLSLDDARELPVIENSQLRDNLNWGVLLKGCVGEPAVPDLEGADNLFIENGQGAISGC